MCILYVWPKSSSSINTCIPVEQKIRDFNKLQCIICFGEHDWMDKIGAYRLQKFNPERYKVFTISKGGHSFAVENPKELCTIIEQYFNDA